MLTLESTIGYCSCLQVKNLEICQGSPIYVFFSPWNYIPPKKLTWIPKMMVWKRWLPLNMAIFGIYVKFLACTSSFKCVQKRFVKPPTVSKTLNQACRFGPESSRQTLVSPIFRSFLVPSVADCFRRCFSGTNLQPCPQPKSHLASGPWKKKFELYFPY